ncbi:hypothetical protein M3P05_18065 [Sansalvadorimonas sp. 2012CJ34-2]|uniref:Uncharacterized protein n=1 Tax=Parendozoicomonas callyspongiae TaxID=2942213 RepID=A0ABT0PKE3_9GAMM|nr:hypothetical protein [Sansalvadorimonas sp. 2012CJ34-2]MCL6271829.1 hypothetical protein [Sansalvadorimonas sp. 2012CJ34-2]
MSRLTPLITIIFLGLITCHGWAEEEQIPPAELESVSYEASPTLQHVLDLVEHVDSQLEELSRQHTITEAMALAGSSALLFIAYNTVRHKILSHCLVDYRLAEFFARLGREDAAYQWILTIFDSILPEMVAGSLITILGKSDPRFPELSTYQTLKAQIFSMMAVGIPGTIMQLLSSKTRLAPYLWGYKSDIFRTVMVAGPIVVTGIHSALARMNLEEQRLYKSLQLRNLRNKVQHLLPNDEIPTRQIPHLQDVIEIQPQ